MHQRVIIELIPVERFKGVTREYRQEECRERIALETARRDAIPLVDDSKHPAPKPP